MDLRGEVSRPQPLFPVHASELLPSESDVELVGRGERDLGVGRVTRSQGRTIVKASGRSTGGQSSPVPLDKEEKVEGGKVRGRGNGWGGVRGGRDDD